MPHQQSVGTKTDRAGQNRASEESNVEGPLSVGHPGDLACKHKATGGTIMPQVGFVKAMKDYFGLLPGQSVIHCGSELKALSHEEKTRFRQGPAWHRH